MRLGRVKVGRERTEDDTIILKIKTQMKQKRGSKE
jgi:hypothetical protein